MTRRAATAAVLAAALAAADAAAQWRAAPMIVRLDPAATDVAVGPFSGAGAGLLAIDQPGARAELRPHRALLAPQPWPFPFPWTGARPIRAGRLAQGGADAAADLARTTATGLQLAFGDAPGTLRGYPLAFPSQTSVPAAALHLLPRSADVLAVPVNLGEAANARLTVVDFDPAAVPTQALQRTFGPLLVQLPTMVSQGFEAVPIRLSAAARVPAAPVDDVAILGGGGLVLLLHAATPSPATLDGLSLSAPIEVGGTAGGAYDPLSGLPPPWLPSTLRRGDTLGVAAVDVNLDGVLDLVFPQAFAQEVLDGQGRPVQGGLAWVEGTGTPADFADWTRAPWRDLGLALGLPDPVLVRPVTVPVAGGGTVPGAAVWDRDLQELLVLWPDGGTDALRAWRGAAPGRLARDVRQVDVAGSPAADLVVSMDGGAGPDTVLVFPDLGLPGPELAWSGAGPGRPVRGVPHALEVTLDPAGPLTVDWIEGAPTTAPVASGDRLLRWVAPGRCGVPPPDLDVTVRAVDGTGVFAELRAVLPVDPLALALSVAGEGGGRLVLPPGGAVATLDATAATSCGAVTLSEPWSALPGAVATDVPAPTGLRRRIALPEAAYPALLADPAGVATLATTDPGASPAAISAALALDAEGLVAVEHAADRAALREGELAVLRTTLRSRLGVALPGVRVRHLLAGLAPAGPPRTRGAALREEAAGGLEVVLEELPGGGAEVVIELTVRATATRGTSAVEVLSSGAARLTPAARTGTALAALPGCGCGGGGEAGSGAALAALALALVRRRRPRPT